MMQPRSPRIRLPLGRPRAIKNDTVGEMAERFNAHAWKMTPALFLSPQTSSRP